MYTLDLKSCSPSPLPLPRVVRCLILSCYLAFIRSINLSFRVLSCRYRYTETYYENEVRHNGRVAGFASNGPSLSPSIERFQQRGVRKWLSMRSMQVRVDIPPESLPSSHLPLSPCCAFSVAPWGLNAPDRICLHLIV